MEANFKKLLDEISHKNTNEIIEDHVKELNLNENNKSVTLIIDRKYALNQIVNKRHIWDVIKWVKKAFWEDYETIIKLVNHKEWRYWNEHHDREMNIPHTIHYS